MPLAARTSALLALTLLTSAADCGGQSPRGESTPARAAAPADSGAPRRLIGYLSSGGVRPGRLQIAELPADKLTHIFYAFARATKEGRMTLGNPCVDVGECPPGDTSRAGLPPGGNFAELRRLKERFPKLRLLISVGGWSGSKHFSDIALTDVSRKAFVASGIEELFRRHPGLFDGIDVDWEFPVRGGEAGNAERPEDKRNFTLLLAELRRQLDEEGRRAGRRYELTIASSANPSEIDNMELPEVVRLLDFVNVMTYDYHNGSKIAHFNSPLYAASDDPTPAFTVDSTVRAYLAGGVPAEKLVIGIPFYGRAFGGVAPERAGLFARATGPTIAWTSEESDYRALARTKLRDPSWIRSWHEGAQVPWLYHPATKSWISYDDARSVAAKAGYARARGLGGVMIWELGGDDGTLLPAVHKALTGAR